MELYPHGVLATLGLAVLTGFSVLAVYRSRDDPRPAAFVAGAYASVALLFHLLRKFERGEGDRGRTKVAVLLAVWLLTTLLTAMFASKVAPMMLLAVSFLVYLMAAGTVGAGFWALFLHQ